MNEPNGWHHSEPVYIQARDGDQALVQYVRRSRTVVVWTNPDKSDKRVIPMWAWVPFEDVVYNWEVRNLA